MTSPHKLSISIRSGSSRRHHPVLLLSILLLAMAGCRQKGNTDGIAAKMEAYLSGQERHFRFNGNVLVAENGKVIFQQSYGYADPNRLRPLNDSSVFELASVSKQFTATGILMLKDRGLLRLDDSLRKFFPELPYAGITVRHLLNHTSGLPDYEEAMNEKWDTSRIAFNSDMIDFLAREKPAVLFRPGEKWLYSNTAYALLATIIEKVSGQSFAEYMAEHIFRPLGMTHTRIYNTRRSRGDTIPNYAYGFLFSDSLKKNMLPDSLPDYRFVIYLDGIQGDGVVNSTTVDLLKWDRAVKSGTLLQEATQKEMVSPQSLLDTARGIHYGYGVFLEKDELGNHIFHSGGWPGYTTYLSRNTDKDQTFIVLSNNQSPSPAICKALEQILAGKPVIGPYEHRAIPLDSAAIVAFPGTYRVNGTKVVLEQRGSKLYRVPAGGSALELSPESPLKFFYTDGTDRQVEFEKGPDNNRVVRAWMIVNGVKMEMKKE